MLSKQLIMKRFFTILFTLISCYSFSQTPTLIHYWNFNGTVNTSVSPVTYDTSDAAISVPTYTIGGASFTYGGAYYDAWAPSDQVNERNPVTNWQGLQAGLRLRNPASGPFIVTLPTTGYKNIVVKYGIQRTTQGSATNTVTYTTDGVHYDSVNMIITNGSIAATTGIGTYTITNTANPNTLVTLDFSSITAVNNNPNFKVKIVFSTTAQSAASGNDRYDNLSAEGLPNSLPLDLVSFNASLINNTVNLVWSTVDEINVDGFDVERSNNARDFSSIGKIAANNSVSYNNYSYIDQQPLSGVSYYRLKMIDKDGTFKYSNIVSMNNIIATASNLSVYPNPVINSFTLTHEKAVNGAVVKVVTIDGRAIFVQSIATGATQSTVDASRLMKGSYLVVLDNNGKISTTQFIK